MLKGHPHVLPRLRSSFPGRPSHHHRNPLVGYLLLVVAACLLVVGFAQLGGFLGKGRSSFGSSSSSSKAGGSARQQPRSSISHAPQTAAALSALQQKAARNSAEAAVRHQQPTGFKAATAEAIQQLQAGMDSLTAGVSSMARSLSEQVSSSSSSSSSDAAASLAAAAAAAVSSQVNFTDISTDVKSTMDALHSRPSVFGKVEKAGVADLNAWLGHHSDSRLDSFISWRVNRTKLGGPGPTSADSYTCAKADHPPLPFPGCHVFVNHAYKYVYIRSPKAASTSIVNMLGECTNVNTAAHNSSTCMILHFYWNATDLTPQNLTSMWKDYFVFGFVRNPWRRAYSLYKYLHSNGCMHEHSLRDPNCRVPWHSFCADPWSAAEELHDKGCIKRSKSYLYFHMEDQFHCLKTADGRWAVDFIGRVDDPNDDWAEVLRSINARRLPEMPEIPITQLEQKNVRAGNFKDPYAHKGAEQCFNSVSRWYACDVERFGFSKLKTGRDE